MPRGQQQHDPKWLFLVKKNQGYKVIAWPWYHLNFFKFSMRAKYGVSFSYASKGIIANAIYIATKELLTQTIVKNKSHNLKVIWSLTLVL